MNLMIGIDDTDSPKKGCTTHVAANLVPRLVEFDCVFTDYPRIVRLNPNIPFKTRGNGAVSLEVTVPQRRIDSVKRLVLDLVKSESDLTHDKTDPCVAFLLGRPDPMLEDFASRCLCDVVPPHQAVKVSGKVGVEIFPIKGRRGIVGAVAAVGHRLQADHTYELIAYRQEQNIGTQRIVDPDSVLKMVEATGDRTFNCYCPEAKRVLITPRGMDPVLFGIRGEDPTVLRKAAGVLELGEEIEKWMIFRTNQGTDAHFSSIHRVESFNPFKPFRTEGEVVGEASVGRGGHVYFTLYSQLGPILCAAYRPTLGLRTVVLRLRKGDHLEVYGGVRKASRNAPRVLNLEKIKILKLHIVTKFRNPLCANCGRRMESAGQGQGFRCRRCGTQAGHDLSMTEIIPRELDERVYLPAPSAHRHLTKPLSRYGRELNVVHTIVEPWFGSGFPT